jgi:multidrug resistance efflux pump
VCGFEGTIATLAVAEGDAVNAGNPIARLADREACVELRKVEAELTQQRARLPCKFPSCDPRSLNLSGFVAA